MLSEPCDRLLRAEALRKDNLRSLAHLTGTRKPRPSRDEQPPTSAPSAAASGSSGGLCRRLGMGTFRLNLTSWRRQEKTLRGSCTPHKLGPSRACRWPCAPGALSAARAPMISRWGALSRTPRPSRHALPALPRHRGLAGQRRCCPASPRCPRLFLPCGAGPTSWRVDPRSRRRSRAPAGSPRSRAAMSRGRRTIPARRRR